MRHKTGHLKAPQSEEDDGRSTVAIPTDAKAMLEKRAKAERRSMGAHLAWLIEQDVKRAQLQDA
jgi:hypothetical protein